MELREVSIQADENRRDKFVLISTNKLTATESTSSRKKIYRSRFKVLRKPLRIFKTKIDMPYLY